MDERKVYVVKYNIVNSDEGCVSLYSLHTDVYYCTLKRAIIHAKQINELYGSSNVELCEAMIYNDLVVAGKVLLKLPKTKEHYSKSRRERYY